MYIFVVLDKLFLNLHIEFHDVEGQGEAEMVPAMAGNRNARRAAKKKGKKGGGRGGGMGFGA